MMMKKTLQKVNYSSNYTLIECLVLPSTSNEIDEQEEGKNDAVITSRTAVPTSSNNTSTKTVILPFSQTHKHCFSINNILSSTECTNIISHTEQSGLYKPAMISVGFGREIYDPEARSSDRCIIDDIDFAQVLFNRIKDYVPSSRDDGSGNEWDIVGLNERFRILRYSKDHIFPWHYDGNFMRNSQERSFMTIMIYLNDGGGVDFEGGSTLFRPGNGEDDVVEYVPGKGDVVVFDHRILHEGAKLVQGKKYAIRTDIMYRRRNKWKDRK